MSDEPTESAEAQPGGVPSPPDRHQAASLRRLAGRSAAYLTSSSAAQLANLALFPILTRALGPAAFGRYAVLLAAVVVGQILLGLGLNTALMKETVALDDARGRSAAWTAFSFTALLGVAEVVVVALLGGVFARWLLGSDDAWARLTVTLAACTVAVTPLCELLLALARVGERPRLFVGATMTRSYVGLALAAAFVWLLGWGVPGAAAAVLCGAAAALVLLLARLWAQVRGAFSLPDLRRMLQLGVWLVPTNLGAGLLDAADRFILAGFMTTTAVGMYAAGYRVGGLAYSLFFVPFHLAYVPFMLKELEAERGESMMRRVAVGYATLGMLVTLLVAAAGPALLRLLAGSAFSDASQVIPLVALGTMFLGSVSVVMPGFLWTSRTYIQAALFLLCAAVNIGLNLVFIPPLGILGAAAATAAAYFLLVCLAVAASHRYVHLPLPLRPLAVVTAAGSAATLGITAVELATLSPAADVGARVACVLAFVLVVVLGGSLPPRELGAMLRAVATRRPAAAPEGPEAAG